MVTLAARDVGVSLGGRAVIERASAAFAGGELIGVIGPNGAGKSTFVRALLGLVPASGAVLLDGVAIGAMRRAEVARRIAYLPQGQTLHWPLTVARLVALGRLPHLAPFSRIGAADRVAIERAMAVAEVSALAERTATDLSGGERARALLARALAVEAPALIVDEPLAALDPGHQLQAMEILRGEAARGGLVIAVLHDLGLAARYCDRLVAMDRGRIVADGTPAMVLNEALLRDVYGVRAWLGEQDGVAMVVPVARV